MATARRSIPDTRLLTLSGALLLLAGLALGAAATIRWAPCVAGADTACVLAQDHSRDYDLVSAPFEPVQGAVLLAGIASVLLAALWTAWAVQAASRGTRAAAAATAVVVAATAVGQLLAALTDGALGVLPAEPGAPSVLAVLLQLLLTVLPAVSAALLLRGSSGLARIAWITMIVGLLLAFPIVEYLALSAGGASYDTPTGFGWLRAGTLVVPGIAFLAGGAGAARSTAGARPAAAARVDG